MSLGLGSGHVQGSQVTTCSGCSRGESLLRELGELTINVFFLLGSLWLCQIKGRCCAGEEHWASWAPVGHTFSLTNTISTALPCPGWWDPNQSPYQPGPMSTHTTPYLPGSSPIDRSPRIWRNSRQMVKRMELIKFEKLRPVTPLNFFQYHWQKHISPMSDLPQL